ncbi:MAG: response regulator [Fluviicola sp.]
MNKRILLIEDNNDVRETTAAILELSQYEVLTARNGMEGAELALKEHPDLIICDIMMPVLDGYGVLHLLSRNKETVNIPFIFLTARAERSDLRKGMDMGADDYVTKPFEEVELLTAIESRLKKAAMMKKEFAGNMNGLNDFLGGLKEFSDMQKLSEENEIRYHRKKDEIYQEGTFPKCVFFVNSGNIKTYRTNEQGKELITGLFKTGDFFGYLALLEDGKYQDSAMTLEDSEIGILLKEDFLTLIYKNPQISRKFIKMITNNLYEKEAQLLDLAYSSVRKRVAEALVRLCDHYNQGTDPLNMVISREDLSNLAGTATETTIRALGDFKKEGLIAIKEGVINVLEYNQLSVMRN